MTEQNNFSRRRVLQFGGLSAVTLSASAALGSALGEVCELTPRQPLGPFYPVSDQDDKNNDLTVMNHGPMANGSILYLTGTVKDQNCEPVNDAVVEIWQACETGRYNHPGDRNNPNPLDPNFQYWGITLSDTNGNYNFKTIIPGHYQAAPGWIRPPHIHFKVYKNGFTELVTQMYFGGNRYNDNDRILKDIPVNERDNVIRPLAERAKENNRTAYDVVFDISLKKII